MNSEEVEVGVEAGEDSVFGAVLDEVGGGGSEEMRTGKEIECVSLLDEDSASLDIWGASFLDPGGGGRLTRIWQRW